MKRLILYSVIGVAAAVEVLYLVRPTVMSDLLDLFPPSLPVPPKGFDVRREGIDHGKLETVEYDSKSVGRKRKMRVYTPPGFDKDKTYPVLYLLHGSLADETSWVKDGFADTILDNLYADKKLVAMIVVMPDSNLFGPPGADPFERELLGEIIPYMEKHYPVKADRQHRALAGVSAGADQALSIALTHPDRFAFMGAFIGGLGECDSFEQKEVFEQEHQEMLKSMAAHWRPKLLWMASGKKDLMYERCQNTAKLFDKYKIPYTFLLSKGLHNWETSRNDLFVFAPLLFRGVD